MEKSESIFINRELSWLDFDSRVLALAKEKTVPLGERLKFAAIFGSMMSSSWSWSPPVRPDAGENKQDR